MRRENKRKKPFMRYAYLHQTSVHGPSSTVYFLPQQLQTKGHNQVDRKAEPFLLSLEWLQQWQKFIHCSTLGACTVCIRPIYLALCVVFQQSINLLFLSSLSSPSFSPPLPFLPSSPSLSPFLSFPFSLPLLPFHFLSSPPQRWVPRVQWTILFYYRQWKEKVYLLWKVKTRSTEEE